MADLASLTADQLAEKVRSLGWGLDDERGEPGAALTELQTRANLRDEAADGWQSDLERETARAEAAEKERDEATAAAVETAKMLTRAVTQRKAAEARLAETLEALEGLLTLVDASRFDANDPWNAEIDAEAIQGRARAALTTHHTAGTPIPEEDQAHCDSANEWPKVDCGGVNCGKCQQCLTVNWHFAQEAVKGLEARLAETQKALDRVAAALAPAPSGVSHSEAREIVRKARAALTTHPADKP